jgi:hypothetical protein
VPSVLQNPALSAASVLGPAAYCIARPQLEGFVVYNPRTDELHLLNAKSYCVYQLCDGLHSVAEIQAALGVTDAEGGCPDEIRVFLEKLVARGLLEIVNA